MNLKKIFLILIICFTHNAIASSLEIDANIQRKLDQLGRISDKRSVEYQTLAVDVAQDLIDSGKEALDGMNSAKALQLLTAGASLISWRGDVVALRKVALHRYLDITNNLINDSGKSGLTSCNDIKDRVSFLQKLAPDSVTLISSFKEKCKEDVTAWTMPPSGTFEPLQLLNQVVPKNFETQEKASRIDLSQELDYITARNNAFPQMELELLAFSVTAAYYKNYEEICDKPDIDQNTTDKNNFKISITCRASNQKNLDTALAAARNFCEYTKKQLTFKCVEKIHCFDGVKTEDICTTKPIASKYREFATKFNSRSILFQSQQKDITEACFQKPDFGSHYNHESKERPIFPFEKNVTLPTMVGVHHVTSDAEKAKTFSSVIFAFSPELSYSTSESKLSVELLGDRKFVPSYVSVKSDKLGSFSEGLASVVPQEAPIFYVNTLGEIAFTLPDDIQDAGLFKNGVARVKKKSGEHAFIDRKGIYIGRSGYARVADFSENLAAIWSEHALGCSYLSLTGNLIVTPPIFSKCDSFSEGLASIVKDGTIFYIDKTGERKINGNDNWEIAGPFRNGFARIKTESNSGFIDTTGKMVISSKFISISDFSDGLALIKDSDYKVGYINKEGKFAFAPIFLKGSSFKEGHATIGIALGKDKPTPVIGIVDTKGNLILFAPDCDSLKCPLTEDSDEKIDIQYINKNVTAASVINKDQIKVDIGRGGHAIYNITDKTFTDIGLEGPAHALAIYDINQCVLGNGTPNIQINQNIIEEESKEDENNEGDSNE